MRLVRSLAKKYKPVNIDYLRAGGAHRLGKALTCHVYPAQSLAARVRRVEWTTNEVEKDSAAISLVNVY